MAREEPKDKWAGLAPADRLLHGAPPHLDLADRAEPTPEALKALALEAEDAARAVEGVTNSEGAGAGAARAVPAIATSHGTAGAYDRRRSTEERRVGTECVRTGSARTSQPLYNKNNNHNRHVH